MQWTPRECPYCVNAGGSTRCCRLTCCCCVGLCTPQATCYRLLLSEGWARPNEQEVMRWAANSSSVTPPKHATRQQYKQATALEALVRLLVFYALGVESRRTESNGEGVGWQKVWGRGGGGGGVHGSLMTHSQGVGACVERLFQICFCWAVMGCRSAPAPFNQSINQCYTCSYEAQKAHASHSLIKARCRST
jgi:hypothetical protein